MSKTRTMLAWCGSLLAMALGLGLSAWAQQGTATRPKPIRIPMEELHKAGGVPPGWKFAFATGDPVKGRKAFVDFECFSCHQVKGEKFPPGKKGDVGPELTGMGGRHPTDYFLESVVNSNAVIVEGPGFTGPDGLSKMPDYRDSMTVAQLIDLVAYLKSLTGRDDHGGRHR
ncbi:MAG: cytochrome c [Candidatus Rokuibacteriota bacterium]